MDTLGLTERVLARLGYVKAGQGEERETLRYPPSTSADYRLASNETVFGAVTLLASTFAAQPLRLYKGWEEEKADPINRLICYRPTSGMDPFLWKRTMEVCRHTTGNAYAVIVPDYNNRVKSLDILAPSMVEPMRASESGEMWYVYRHPDAPVLYLPERMVIHCSHISTAGDKGINPLRVLSPSLAYSDRMREFSLRQAKGVSGSVVLEVPGSPGEERSDKIVKRFEEAYKRSDSGIMVLGSGAKATTIPRAATEGKMLDVDRMTVNRAARVYTLPPTLLGDYSQSSYNSQEQQSLDYIQRSIVTTNAMYEGQMNMKLLTYKQVMEGWHLSFDKTVLQVTDAATRAEVEQKQLRSGAATIDEIRAGHGRPPVPGGDRPMVSGDLYPLGEPRTQK